MSAPDAVPKIRVLIADDHPVVRTGLALLLRYEPDMEAVAEAADGNEALALFLEHRPDVALVDLRMPGGGGAEATAAICAASPGARVILLSTYDGDEDVYRGLRAGARAYLLKGAPCEEILEAVRAVHAGQTRVTAAAGARLLERLAGAALTERERAVLGLMARGLGNRGIAASLFVSEGTVKFHVNHILSKLGVGDRTQAVLAALKRGIVTLE